MNKGVMIAVAVTLAGVLGYALLPQKEPTIEDKLAEAKSSLTEAAELVKESVESKAEDVSDLLETSVADARKAATDLANDLAATTQQASSDFVELRKQIEKEFGEGGALHQDGFNPSRAIAALTDMGLSEEEAQKFSSWLADLYAAPEHAEDAIAAFMERLKK